MIGESGEIVCGQSRRLNLNLIFFFRGSFCVVVYYYGSY